MTETKGGRDDMIRDFIPFVEVQVFLFLRKKPQFRHIRQDLLSTGLARLVKVVDKYLKGEIKSLKAYLRLSIRSGLWDAVRAENTIQKPRHCTPKRVFVDDHLEEKLPLWAVSSSESLDLACRCLSDRIIVGLLREGEGLATMAAATEQTTGDVRQQLREIYTRYGVLAEESRKNAEL